MITSSGVCLVGMMTMKMTPPSLSILVQASLTLAPSPHRLSPLSRLKAQRATRQGERWARPMKWTAPCLRPMAPVIALLSRTAHSVLCEYCCPVITISPSREWGGSNVQQSKPWWGHRILRPNQRDNQWCLTPWSDWPGFTQGEETVNSAKIATDKEDGWPQLVGGPIRR